MGAGHFLLLSSTIDFLELIRDRTMIETLLTPLERWYAPSSPPMDSFPKRRIKMALRLSKEPVEARWDCQPIKKENAQELGSLMLAAYRDTVDYEGETLAEAISEVAATIEGKYGPLFVSASGFIQRGNQIASAVLVTLFGNPAKPFVSYSMTHPEFKRQGMAAFLLRRAVHQAAEEGFQELQLVVTQQNTSALRLYEKLGFRAQTSPNS